jgi:hypothetical protein
VSQAGLGLSTQSWKQFQNYKFNRMTLFCAVFTAGKWHGPSPSPLLEVMKNERFSSAKIESDPKKLVVNSDSVSPRGKLSL